MFRKSDLPFGLTPQQVDLLRAGADLVIVEGPMDALAVNVARPDLVAVAPLGTALTAGHLTTLNRIAPLTDRRVLLLLDDDKAGRAASVRAWRALVDAGVTDAEAITLGEGKDPAELLATRGPDALAAALDRRYPLADLVVDEITHRWTDGNDFVEHRINALREAAHLIGTMPPAEQTRQASRLAEHLDLDYLTVIDAILDNTPPDPDAVAPDPTDPLGLPKRPTLSTDPQPGPDPGRDRSESADRWRDEQTRQARTNTAAALLVDAWADRPDLAQRVANAAAMADIADRIEQLQQDGVDVRQVLADLPTADLELVDDPAAYAADLLDPAEARTAQDVDEQDLSRVADLITQTWHDAPDLARQVIEDPRFPSTVLRGHRRREPRPGHHGPAGGGSTPHRRSGAGEGQIRGPRHPRRRGRPRTARPGAEPHPTDNPTWHLDGAADVLRGAWREHPDVAEKLITGPGFDVLADRMAHAQQAGLDAGALLETIDPDKIAAADVPSPAGITAAALTRAAADAQIPAWTEREYGHLTDETLADELARARAATRRSRRRTGRRSRGRHQTGRRSRRRPRTSRHPPRTGTRRTAPHRRRTRPAQRPRGRLAHAPSRPPRPRPPRRRSPNTTAINSAPALTGAAPNSTPGSPNSTSKRRRRSKPRPPPRTSRRH